MAITEIREVTIEATPADVMGVLIDLLAPLPGFLIRKGAKGLMDTAAEGLRTRTLEVTSG